MGEWLRGRRRCSGRWSSPGGFYRGEAVPAAHFRTSVTAAPDLLASAVAVLLDDDVGGALSGRDRPAGCDVVDLGAGGGELLAALAGDAARRRCACTASTSPRGRPALPRRVAWSAELPDVDRRARDRARVPRQRARSTSPRSRRTGRVRLVLVDPTTGAERLGDPVDGEDAAWLARWWPLDGAPPGARAEIGRARDAAWADVVGRVRARRRGRDRLRPRARRPPADRDADRLSRAAGWSARSRTVRATSPRTSRWTRAPRPGRRAGATRVALVRAGRCAARARGCARPDRRSTGRASDPVGLPTRARRRRVRRRAARPRPGWAASAGWCRPSASTVPERLARIG